MIERSIDCEFEKMVRGLSLVLCGCAVAKRINFRYMIDGLVGRKARAVAGYI
jgi:hypothetical protein